MLSEDYAQTRGLLTLWTPGDVQVQLSEHLRKMRKDRKLSRRKLAEMSGVPEPTIKRFETTGQISLRQFLLLWGRLDQLDDLRRFLMEEKPKAPKSLLDFFEKEEKG